MIALVVLILLLALLVPGGLWLGNVVWFILAVLLVLWLAGYFVGGAAGGPRGYWRRW